MMMTIGVAERDRHRADGALRSVSGGAEDGHVPAPVAIKEVAEVDACEEWW